MADGSDAILQTWTLEDARQSFVLAAKRTRLPQVVYWGPRLPEGEDVSSFLAAGELDVTGGMLDENPDLSILPEATRTFPGQPGLIVHSAGGRPILSKFCFESEEVTPNAVTLRYRDEGNSLTYTARFEIDPETHILTTRSYLDADSPVHLHWLANPVVPAPQLSDEMIDISGKWCGEFQLNRTAWSPGIRYRENRTGRSGHEHFPALIVPGKGATNTQGEAWAFHYGWSGGHRMIAEELPDGRRQIQFGHATGLMAEPMQEFASAPLYMAYSDTGLNGCAVAFQRHVRDRIVCWPQPDRPRPVHYNCWEAVYFKHELPVLKDIAERAAKLGAERFVLDDGWFGTRDDDTRSLSDWEVDRRKYPEGLHPLIDHVHDLGMSFGIWFEPEMINPDSDVFRANPDWALGGEDQILGRGQMAIDMGNPDVRDFIYTQMEAILKEYPIDYIKWDHNRVLPYPDQAQTQGSYALIDRLRAAFPDIEIESCASGGGRIDFGILQRTQRVWLSDSNDALERLEMQHNAALFLPAAITGSHVGPRLSHTSGRDLDIRFRAWVAAQRHMGFEMDPRELTDEETRVLSEVTAWWKANRDWMMAADILRLDAADPAIMAEQQMAQDASRFVVFAGQTETSRQITPRPLRLTGLDPNATYRIALANRLALTHLSRGAPLLKNQPLEVSGTYLMHSGVVLPWSMPQSIWVLEGRRV